MADIKDNTRGGLKYPKLNKLALHCLLVLPHGNSNAERGFSISKFTLKVHVYSTKEGYLLITSFRVTRSSYVAFLEGQ